MLQEGRVTLLRYLKMPEPIMFFNIFPKVPAGRLISKRCGSERKMLIFGALSERMERSHPTVPLPTKIAFTPVLKLSKRNTSSIAIRKKQPTSREVLLPHRLYCPILSKRFIHGCFPVTCLFFTTS